MQMKRVLLIDDQLDIWEDAMRRELAAYGYELFGLSDPKQAIKQIEICKPDVVLLDILFPAGNLGKPTLAKIKDKYSTLPVIMITSTMDKSEYHPEDYAQADYRYSKLALAEGDFSDLAQHLDDLVNKYQQASSDIDKNAGKNALERFGFITGKTPAMQEVCRTIEKIAEQDVTVLIEGESGTGKELVARAIHRLSHRRSKPFAGIVCAAIPGDLLESELFGHEKGSFTGAINQKIGKLEAVEDGTLFLDEISEVPHDIQVKLLRFLQEKEFVRLGSTKTIPFKGRVVTATNRNLVELVKNGEFREDLYYRLNIVSIQLPPLRERREDIPALFSFFVQKANELTGKRVLPVLREDVQALFMNQRWPGNIREFENTIQRAVALAEENILQKSNFPKSKEPEGGVQASLLDLNATVEAILSGGVVWKNLKNEFGASGTLRKELLMLLIQEWQMRNHRKPTGKDLGELLKTSHGNMRRILSESDIKLSE